MRRARIANQHCLFLDGMAALTVGGAWVDRMFEVQALAHGVALDDLVAHDGGERKNGNKCYMQESGFDCELDGPAKSGCVCQAIENERMGIGGKGDRNDSLREMNE